MQSVTGTYITSDLHLHYMIHVHAHGVWLKDSTKNKHTIYAVEAVTAWFLLWV